jgi:hypothetical protein
MSKNNKKERKLLKIPSKTKFKSNNSQTNHITFIFINKCISLIKNICHIFVYFGKDL